MRRIGLVMGLVVCASSALFGCGDGGSGSGKGGGGSGGAAGGSGGSTGGSGGATSSGGSGGMTSTGGTGGAGDFAVCEGKFQNQTADCQSCVQDKCKDSLIACCQTDGCTEIIQCARDNMCGGIDCYAGPGGADGPCKTIIDMYGGPVGDGAGAAQTFGNCAQPGCPMCTM